jgi:glycosyltransferase involved in cell wall biosynthesis
MPAITVIIPVKDRMHFIEKALQSIANQQVSDLQIIIVDDGSTDQTVQRCLKFKKNSGIALSIIHTKNAGPARARNLAIQQSNSDFIAFLDSDDWWPKDRLQSHLNAYCQEPNADIIVGKTKLIADSLCRQKDFRFKADCLHSTSLTAATFKTNVFDKIGLLDSSLAFGEDTDFFFRVREKRLLVVYVEQVGLYYRLHDTNMTNHKSSKELNMFRVLRQSLQRRNGQHLPPMGFNQGSNDGNCTN